MPTTTLLGSVFLICVVLLSACADLPMTPSEAESTLQNEQSISTQEIATATSVESMTTLPVLEVTTLQPYLWNNRLLLIFARAAAEPVYVNQLSMYDGLADELLDRNMIWFHIFAERSDSQNVTPSYVDEGQKPLAKLSAEQLNQLRNRYNPNDAPFRVVLIGKDGGVKYDTTELFGPDQLFPIIDAMPMRQQEMRQSNP